tara:strand:+ start:213 stop:878 length:666 start_codon:yes stop_codon:yes gene_type:complete
MHNSVSNLIDIQKKIKDKINLLSILNYNPQIIAVSKTFKENDIEPLLKFGQKNFGENKVQEALNKWPELKKNYSNVKLHMLGKLQTNKVKHAVEIFDYIHSLDNLKLAEKLANEIYKKNKDIKLFIQINLDNEIQKSGIAKSNLENFYKNCADLKLNVIGTMCIPPEGKPPQTYFHLIKELNNKLGLNEISMGMTNDYLEALDYKSTFLRIGSGIFGQRIN